MTLSKAIGDMLRRERLSRELTQADVAKRVGVQQSRVAKIERGCATVGAMSRYADALGLRFEIHMVPR